MYKYLDKKVLFYKYQSLFRGNFSKNPCIVLLMGFILRGIEKGLPNGMILVDLQKSLWQVISNCMFTKIEMYWFQGVCH